LENVVLESKGKKVLIISKLKRSETIILRQRILQWFKNQITKIDIIPPRELCKTDIKSYDTIFTTEEVTDSMSGAFVPISLFPTDQDYSRMNIAINGFKSVDSIMELFDSELFFYGDVKDKNEVINKLIKLAKLKYNLPNKFDELIYSRENMSSTYFGSKIAMPHTLYPITQNTFIVVGLLANEIFWDDDHKVKLVLLVSTEINNPKAFQVWASLSHLVSDEALSDKLTNATSFNDITLIIKNRLKNFL
jgi:lichenan operon transcriptional antiterminator